MTTRGTLGWLVLLLVGCSPQLGRVRVSVVFENETRTQCIKASARAATGATVVAGTPPAIPRQGKDTLVIGLGETSELKGEVRVTVARFTSADCTGTAFASETKVTEIVHGAATAMLEFRFSDPVTDGGVDAGVDGGADAGVDAGCDTAACGNAPGDCELLPATGCQSDGGCRFSFRAAQSLCPGGVCNSMGTCLADVCAVFDAGAACDDGLMCTQSSSCVNGACRGTCPAPPQCNLAVQPIACDLTTPTACALRPSGDFTSCTSSPGGQCFDGGCLPWLQFAPLNFPSTVGSIAYPTDAWTIASPDGGVCDTIISTSGSMATLVQGDCGAPTLTSSVDDAGVSVITMTGLDVGPGARLHFVGTRPVQVLVLGSASIRGTISVAPLLGGQQPAGTQSASCSAVQAGTATRQGGGGGGFGGAGGRGGDVGGMGGNTTPTLTPLRGGCAGGSGFRTSGASTPGTGGGALQLIVADALTLNGGIITASGEGGAAGTADGEGAGGGGSGGALIIEARLLNLTGGAVTANGGGGGEGGDSGQTSASGAMGPLQSTMAAAAADDPGSIGGPGGIGGDNTAPNGGVGGDHVSGGKGGGGGGGSAGVVFIRGSSSCTRGGGIISGAQPMSISCN